ncbi:MAG: hypothetical protein U9N45_05820, partial [Gemmatimonadota bacterium]|nr:hypothetical protein [Gemmatimonadota bacterium]
MIDKIYIKDQIELNRLPALLEEADELEYFRSIIEEISARDYAGVVNVSYDSKISLAMLNKFLDRMARELFKLDQMPKSCEIATLQLMVSTRAEGKNLINFYGARQLDEQEVTKLYFMVFSTESNENILDMIYDLQLRKMMDYIWDKGLLRFFNNRYLKLETARDDDLSINSVIEAVGLPAVFDESGLIQRYAEESTEESSEKVDFKENFYLENKRKSKALTVLHRIYDMLDEYPCDFKRLREMMLSLNMDSEVGKIEYDGIKSLRDYIRSKGVVGAHEVAKRYDLVFPALAGESLAHARSIINTYFYSQARNTRKGRFFLRSEVIYNLQSSVHSGRCYRFPGGCLLAIIRTKDNDEH